MRERWGESSYLSWTPGQNFSMYTWAAVLPCDVNGTSTLALFVKKNPTVKIMNIWIRKSVKYAIKLHLSLSLHLILWIVSSFHHSQESSCMHGRIYWGGIGWQLWIQRKVVTYHTFMRETARSEVWERNIATQTEYMKLIWITVRDWVPMGIKHAPDRFKIVLSTYRHKVPPLKILCPPLATPFF